MRHFVAPFAIFVYYLKDCDNMIGDIITDRIFNRDR